MYITSAEYASYMGVSAPSNFDRLLDLTIAYFRSICPQTLPTEAGLEEETEEYQDWFKKALYEQIKFFNDNETLLEGVDTLGGGFSIGKYNENNPIGKNTDQILRMSPNAYNHLINTGLLYQGIYSVGDYTNYDINS